MATMRHELHRVELPSNKLNRYSEKYVAGLRVWSQAPRRDKRISIETIAKRFALTPDATNLIVSGEMGSKG